MFLFYDFETSSRELLGQIISYAFVLTDSHLEPLDTLTGTIKLNKTQCPEVGAILTNKININDLQKKGQPEYEAAEQVFNFISTIIASYGQITLVGFNSNNFDLGFLRNLLVRYGFNPYFSGKLKNLDILHWIQSIAFYNSENFSWVLTEKDEKRYYSFKLEDITQANALLSTAQSHDAFEDVILTIKLVTYFEQKYKFKLTEFTPISLPNDYDCQTVLKQRYRHFPEDNSPPEKYIYRYFLPLVTQPKTLLLIKLDLLKNLLDSHPDRSTITNSEKLECIHYINSNKHFFNAESCLKDEVNIYESMIEFIQNDSYFNSIKTTPKIYFQAIKKDWDIEYQIHDIGFDHHIDTLRKLKHDILANPQSYTVILNQLLTSRKTQQDTYLIQLFNRMYLNIIETADLALLNRYLKPRYVTKQLYRNNEEALTFLQQKEELEKALLEPQSDNDISLLLALKDYYNFFESQLTTTV